MKAHQAVGLTLNVLLAICAVAVLNGRICTAMVPPEDIAYLDGTAYANGVIGGGAYSIHQIDHLNDGLYGNDHSWIADRVVGAIGGIQLGHAYRIDAVAFGRAEVATFYTDRVPSNFTIQGQLGAGGFTIQRTETGRTNARRVQYDFFQTGTPGTDTVFVADDVIVNITATNTGTEPCIDELEIYGRPVNVPDGRAPWSNLAQRPEAGAFASSVVGGYPDRHTIAGLTDGQYGNLNSWIPANAGSEYAGVDLGRLVQVGSIAFGRDNTDVSIDRVAPSYVLQYTTAQTTNYNDPTITWTAIATVDRNYAPGGGTVRADFAGRMQYDLTTPVEATAIRVVSSGQVAIDELEVLGAAPPSDSIATRGTAYASSVIGGGAYAIHQTAHLNDGMYGNTHSWISNESHDGTAGIQLDGAYRIDAVALGRDNGGEPNSYTDRVPSNFTIESSLGGGPFGTRQTVAGRTDPLRVQYDFVNGGGSGQISTWEADRVQVNVSLTDLTGGSATQPCIDELEIYGRPTSVAGFDAATATGNLARKPGATAMASSVLSGYSAHTIGGLTDGQYGNSNSWIPAGGGAEWGGVSFGGSAPVMVNLVAFGRDNTDYYKDRVLSSYDVEYTLDDPADPNARWQVRSTVGRDYAPGGGTVRPGFSGRMEYGVGQMPARGVRISFASGQPAIDELEAIGYAPEPMSFQLHGDNTAAASSQHSSMFGVGHINDGIQGTSSGSPARYWNDGTNNVAGDWARITWDETKLVRYVNLRMPLTNYDLPTSTVPGVKVQYLRPGGNADNNNDWLDYAAPRTLVAPNAAGSNPNPNNYYDNAPLITQGIRAYFTTAGNDDGWNFLDEIEAVGSPNIARSLGAQPFASSQHSSGLYPLSALNDGVQTGNNAPGIPSGYWNDDTQSIYPDYAGIMFFRESYVDGVNLRTPIINLGNAARAIDDVSVQYLALGGDPNDSGDWLTLIDGLSLVAPTTNDGTQNNFFAFAPIYTQAVRAYFGPGSGNDGGWNYLDEIEVFGLATVPEPSTLSLALLGFAALGLVLARRRRRKA